MKKYISFLIFMLIAMPVFGNSKTVSTGIQDEIVNSGYLPKKTIRKKHGQIQITDELLDPRMYYGTPFRLSVFKNKNKENPIRDELINSEFTENAKGNAIAKKETPDDFFFERNIDVTKARKIKPKTKYDFTKKQIPIRIRIAEHMKSTKGTLEGTDIPFVAEHDFVIKGKKYAQGTTIMGRVETISDSDKMGVPECIKIDNFYIAKDGEEINLHGSVSKMGANRSIWVYPLYQAGNICLYVAGFVFVPIHGGRAKLLTSESFTVYYETQ